MTVCISELNYCFLLNDVHRPSHALVIAEYHHAGDKEGSLMNKGTLKQIENLIDRSSVPKVVKTDFNAARDS